MIAGLLAAGCGSGDEAGRLSQYDTTDASILQWKLPGKLREISGLALAPDDRLFAVTDETAVVFEIDYEEGAIVKTFSFQDPVVRGDFEGIAWLNGLFYVVTSDGILYAGPEGGDGKHVEANRVDTGLGGECEIEGLAEKIQTGHLFLVCKALVRGSSMRELQIFEWSPLQNELVRSIEIPVDEVAKALHTDHFNPSGIVVDRNNDNFIVVAARQHSLVVLGAEGQLLDARRFRHPSRHKQAEGIEMLADGKLLVADEGGDKKARLAVYSPRQSGESR